MHKVQELFTTNNKVIQKENRETVQFMLARMNKTEQAKQKQHQYTKITERIGETSEVVTP